MLRLIQKLHVFAGLQTCIALMLFGVAGLASTWQARPGAPPGEAHARELDFAAPAQASDRQLADLLYEQLHTPLAAPVPDFALQHDARGQLQLAFYTPNGTTRVTVLGDAQRRRLHIEETRADLAEFLTNMHSITWSRPGSGTPRLLVLWSLYTELSIFALLFLSLSGVYQWLATRAEKRVARASFLVGLASLVLVYVWMH